MLLHSNTKGKGSDDGRFIGTNVLNENILGTIPVTLNKNIRLLTELKILQGVARDLNVVAPDFCKRLTDWATLSVRPSMMVVSKRLSLPVVWSM